MFGLALPCISSSEIPASHDPDNPPHLRHHLHRRLVQPEPHRRSRHFSPAGSLTINGSAAIGRAAITAAAHSFMSAFHDMQVLMDKLLVRDDTHATYYWTLIGTNTGPNGTGHRVHISCYEEWSFGADNLIAASDGHFDADTYQQQLQHGDGN
jgi:hypothetical protein